VNYACIEGNCKTHTGTPGEDRCNPGKHTGSHSRGNGRAERGEGNHRGNQRYNPADTAHHLSTPGTIRAAEGKSGTPGKTKSATRRAVQTHTLVEAMKHSDSPALRKKNPQPPNKLSALRA